MVLEICLLLIKPTTVIFLWVFAVCGRTRNFLRLLADRILRIKHNLTSFHRLHHFLHRHYIWAVLYPTKRVKDSPCFTSKMSQVGLTYYLGLNHGQSVSIKCQLMRKHFSRNIHSLDSVWMHVFQFCHTRQGILTRIRACELWQKFCKHEQPSTHPIFVSNFSRGQILRALSKWMGPFDNNKIYFHCIFTVYLILFYVHVNDSIINKKKRNFPTTSMLYDGYSAFHHCTIKLTECFKGGVLAF